MLGPTRGARAPVALLVVAVGAAGAGHGYDCSDHAHLQAWPQAQKDVCCIIKGVGCEQVAQGPTTTMQGTSVTIYDCTIGRESWDGHQQNWCCEHWNLGCSGSLHNQTEASQQRHQVHDCNKDLDQWSTTWSQSKQDWCCGHWGLGCSSTVDFGQDASEQYECEQGIMNWHKGWSNAKKAYCCEHASKEIQAQLRDGDGCSTPTTQSPTPDGPRCQAIVSETPGTAGWTATFAPGWYDSDAYVSAGAIGSAGAVTVDTGDKGCTAFVYGGGDFTGQSATFAPGTYQQEDLDKLGVPIMSIKVIEANVTMTTTTASVTSTTSTSTTTSRTDSSTLSTTSTSTTSNCANWTFEESCGWTLNYSCPGQPAGSLGQATDDGGEGYACCCGQRLWAPAPKAGVIEVDCWENLSNWEDTWSSEKKGLCCGAHFKCPGVVDGLNGTGEKPFPWDPVLGGYICESLVNVSGVPTAGKQKAMQWCCEREKIGCTTDAPALGAPPPPATTEAPEFDCQEGLENAKDGWSEEKKEWCCEREKLGCVQTFDCNAGKLAWRTGWSQDKKDYCCEQQMWKGNGCPFDCKVAKPTWRTSWTKAKKDWCCQHGDDKSVCGPTTTPTTTTTTGPECVSTPDWTNGYADCQKDDTNQAECTPTGYTCKGYQIRGFCADGKVLQNFTAGNLYHHPELNCCECGGGFRAKDYKPVEGSCNVSWPGKIGAADCGECTHVVSAENHSTCDDYCRDIGLQCFHAAEDYNTLPGSTSTDCPVKANATCSDNLSAMDVKSNSMICGCKAKALVFDCAGDDADSWSHLKRAWCCANRQLGCTTTTSTRTVSETSATSSSETGTLTSATTTKTATATVTSATATVTSATATVTSATATKPAYNCTVGLLNPLANWSMLHQGWCCEHENAGCPPTTTSTKAPFDCRAGLWNWHEGWSDKKKNWCCSNEKLGCQKATETTTTTSRASAGGGVPLLGDKDAPRFDCFKDLDRWREKWHADKREYCCHSTVECPDEVSEDEFDCWANLSTWEDSWSDEQIQYCCGQHFQCPKSVAPVGTKKTGEKAFPWDAKLGKYTCEGLDNVTGSVSPGKKKAMQWCCENKNIGCPADVAVHSSKQSHGAPDVAVHSSKQSHGATMKAESTTTTATTSATAPATTVATAAATTTAAPKTGGTTAANASAGSTSTAAVGSDGENTTEQFDCEEGLNDSMTGWTVAKYEWCCHNKNVGCLDDADLLASVSLVKSTRKLATGRPWTVALVLGSLGLAAATAFSLSRRSRQYRAVDPMMTEHLGAVDGEPTGLSGCEGLNVVRPE